MSKKRKLFHLATTTQYTNDLLTCSKIIHNIRKSISSSNELGIKHIFKKYLVIQVHYKITLHRQPINNTPPPNGKIQMFGDKLTKLNTHIKEYNKCVPKFSSKLVTPSSKIQKIKTQITTIFVLFLHTHIHYIHVLFRCAVCLLP